PRHVEVAAVALARDGEVAIGRIVSEAVVERRVLDRVPEHVVLGHVLDPLAAIEHAAPVPEALPVLLRRAKAPLLVRRSHSAAPFSVSRRARRLHYHGTVQSHYT